MRVNQLGFEVRKLHWFFCPKSFVAERERGQKDFPRIKDSAVQCPRPIRVGEFTCDFFLSAVSCHPFCSNFSGSQDGREEISLDFPSLTLVARTAIGWDKMRSGRRLAPPSSPFLSLPNKGKNVVVVMVGSSGQQRGQSSLRRLNFSFLPSSVPRPPPLPSTRR